MVSALWLLLACGPPALPEVLEDPQAWRYVVTDGLGVGRAAAALRLDGDQGWEQVQLPLGKQTLTLRGASAQQGETWRWTGTARLDDRWERWTVTCTQGRCATEGQRGLARLLWPAIDADLFLEGYSADGLPGPEASLLAWSRALKDPAASPVQGLDPRTGRAVPLRVEARGAVELRLGRAPVAARQIYTWSPSRGHSAWIEAETGRLLGLDRVGGYAQIWAEDLLPIPEEVVPPPAGVQETPFSVTRPDLTLRGTRTAPTGAPRATVVLLHGSGPGDRDGNYGVVKPWIFRDLAYALAARGYEVLRYDKRGAGQSQPADEATLHATLDDLLADGAAVMGQGGACQFLIGHSEGGYLAPALAVADPRVAGAVLLAGPAHRLDVVLRDQLVPVLQTQGATPEEVTLASRGQDAMFRQVGDGGTPDDARAAWLRSHFRYDAEGVLHRLQTPILALYAERDIQVLPAVELPAMQAALAHNPDATVEVWPGVDHLFLAAQGADLGAYADPARRVAPALLARVADWIDARPCP